MFTCKNSGCGSIVCIEPRIDRDSFWPLVHHPFRLADQGAFDLAFLHNMHIATDADEALDVVSQLLADILHALASELFQQLHSYLGIDIEFVHRPILVNM